MVTVCSAQEKLDKWPSGSTVLELKLMRLPEITVIDQDGRINHNGGEFAGLMRYDARIAVFDKLKAMG